MTMRDSLPVFRTVTLYLRALSIAALGLLILLQAGQFNWQEWSLIGFIFVAQLTGIKLPPQHTETERSRPRRGSRPF